MPAVHEIPGGTGGKQNTLHELGFLAGEAGLGHGRDIRKGVGPGGTRDRQRAQLAALDVGGGCRQRNERRRRVPSDRRRHCGSRAVKGHVDEVDAGRKPEQLSREMG